MQFQQFQTEFEIMKPYLTWGMILLLTLVVIMWVITDANRKVHLRKIRRFFPLQNGPLTSMQIRLIKEKVEMDLKILIKDLKEWEKTRNEQKITECKIIISNIEEIYYLTQYRLLTIEQVRSINEYMLAKAPIWKKTEIQHARIG